MKRVIYNLGVVAAVGLSFCQNIFAKDPIVQPKTRGEVIASLQDTLTASEIRDIAHPDERDQSYPRPNSDISVYLKWEVKPPASWEGIPPIDPNSALPDSHEIREVAYRGSELIKKALEEREEYPLGERVFYLEEKAFQIVRASKNREDERLMRFTLNRCIDITSHVLAVIGKNEEENARSLANFYVECFDLALSFVNNHFGYRSREEADRTTVRTYEIMSAAGYGNVFANFLWRYARGFSSETAKTIWLMRMVEYLGWDMNLDLRRREPGISQTIVDVYELQASSLYQGILAQLSAGYEPTAAQSAQFRSQVFRILSNLTDRLVESGVITETNKEFFDRDR